MGCTDSKSTKVDTQSKKTKPTIVLYYFAIRGRAEPIRLILHYSGIKFDDRRLTREEWINRKKNGEFCGPFGQMPWAEINGEVIAQSMALLRFAAREGGVLGQNTWETAKADSLVDTQVEILEKVIGVMISSEEDAVTKKAEFVSNELPVSLKRLELTLQANDGGNGFLVGSKITHADFVFLNVCDTVDKLLKSVDKEDVMDNYPLLKGLKQRIQALPQLKDYLNNRPDSDL